MGWNTFGARRKAFVAVLKVDDVELKLPVYPMPGQTPGTVGISMGYGRGANNENIGRAAFQCDESGNHMQDENGNLVTVGANAFELCSFKKWCYNL